MKRINGCECPQGAVARKITERVLFSMKIIADDEKSD
jgi:hypothetical protein